jgi:hypothetical protein
MPSSRVAGESRGLASRGIKVNANNNNAHVAGCGTIVGLVFCAAVGAFFHFAPVHSTPAAPVAPKNCLPGAYGCIPFDKIIQQMNNEPDTVPANPAAANE